MREETFRKETEAQSCLISLFQQRGPYYDENNFRTCFLEKMPFPFIKSIVSK